MSPSVPSPESIIADLACRGWSVARHFLPDADVSQLAREALRAQQQQLQANAGLPDRQPMGPDSPAEDFIQHLAEHPVTAARSSYLARLEELRVAARSLRLDLETFEGHLAIYPPGTFYHKHIDRFHADDRRALTCVLYLNADWDETDGGQLRLYLDDERYFDILPEAGTLVAFLSDRIWHEVLPTLRDRMSITGWFRTREALAA